MMAKRKTKPQNAKKTKQRHTENKKKTKKQRQHRQQLQKTKATNTTNKKAEIQRSVHLLANAGRHPM